MIIQTLNIVLAFNPLAHFKILILQIGRSKPVAFAVKTNVAFEGSLDDDSPVHGSAVSFAIGDYLHVMER